MNSLDGERKDLSLEEVRARIAESRGPRFWRSLEELGQSEQFQELLEREFPKLLPGPGTNLSRRRFLQLMGASMALAGLNACTVQPDERIVPYVKQPEQLVPGKPLYFATAYPGPAGYALGLLVESHMGRPTKVEGNPEHPASLGATDAFAQASVLDLYDPHRAQAPSRLRRIRSWSVFEEELAEALVAQEALGGAGLRVLSRTSTSPTLASQRDKLRTRFPQMKWVTYEATAGDGPRRGAREAFGRSCDLVYDVAGAAVVVALESDFLADGPGSVRYARDFVDGRRVVEQNDGMNRLYCVESAPTTTSALADHRLPLRPADVERFVLELAGALGVVSAVTADPSRSEWVDAIAADLRAHRGAGLVVAGESLSAQAHVLVHAINGALDNLGRTVQCLDPLQIDGDREQLPALADLVTDLESGGVDVLLVLGGNPAYDAPADLGLAAAIPKAKLTVHLSSHYDETAELCQWHLPQSHYLESWSDARAYDGSVSIVQPLIQPLYTTRTTEEFLNLLVDGRHADGHDLVRARWQDHAGGDFERDWKRWLHEGLVLDTRPASRAVTVQPGAAQRAATALASADAVSTAVVFRPDPTVFDGRFANNGWLQECPKPLTKLTWDNAALVSPRSAERWGVANEDHVELTVGDARCVLPAWVLPGLPDDTVLVHLGYGRTRGGQVAAGAGFDVNPIRTSTAFWSAEVSVRKAGGRTELACTQDHHSMENRHLVRTGTFEEFQRHPDFAHAHDHHGEGELPSLMPGYEYDGNKWGLTVDLSACMGCNACLVSCVAENNIPVVGKDQVLNGRELHWIRIDRYFEGELDSPQTHNQPVMCMQCEQAPCEVVCPVAATVHSDEGLNDMVYNRCVGTRYCSNNCPYKVRRFNYFEYSDQHTESLKLQRNPDVTVRTRGVMEKCTYCVQRISQARIEAGREGRPIADGEITTACQQACPTQAISFGNMNDPQAKVTRWKESPLDYGLLTELGTRPRTTYLAKVRNPNPRLASAQPTEDHHG